MIKLIDINAMERLAGQKTFIHSLDPRCKLILTLMFTIAVVSTNRYATITLLPFFSYPLFLIIVADIPLLFLVKKLVIVSFFAFMLGIANPLLDKAIAVEIGGIAISGGWLSFASIMIRFSLTAGVALLLLMTTGMYNLSKGLEKLGIPKVFIIQLFFLYRYIFVLTDEASRIINARSARSFGKKGLGITVFNHILSSLFMRSIDRAERIYTAMRCRGFNNGSIATLTKLHWSYKETLFLGAWTLLFVIFKYRILFL